MYHVLIRSIREYRKPSIMASFYVLLEVIMECTIPFILANMVNDIQASQPMSVIYRSGLLLVGMAVLSLIFGILAGRRCATGSAGFAKNLRADVFAQVQGFSFENIDSFSSSSLLTRLTTDVTNVQNAYMMIIRAAIRSPLMFVFSFIMAYVMGGSLAVIFVAVVPLLMVGLVVIVRLSRKVFSRVFHKYDAMNNTIQENVKAIRLVKSLVREDHEVEKFDATALDVKYDFTKAERILAFNAPLMQSCLYIDTILILLFGSYVIVNQLNPDFSVGQLSSLLTYSFMILNSLMMLSMVLVMITMAIESAKRIVEVLEAHSTIDNIETAVHQLDSGSLEFKDVSFKYSETALENVIDQVSFSIPSGNTVGIIGVTGSGKSTLVQLIPRLYDVNSGSISIDGNDIRDIDLTLLRDAVGMVLQKNTLFSGTVRENLQWGDQEACDEALDHVCEIAQAAEIIRKLPQGYDTYIEQGGVNLSGGQRQRLCIARALLKRPKILIFDDSTSAVDTKTDELIRRGLQNYMPDTTKIIISQRILSVQDADSILVIDQGRIVAQGSHESLISQDGLYRELYLTQQGGK